MSGNSINIDKVNDSMFWKKLVSDWVAIIPSSDVVVVSCDGKINVLTETKHGFGRVSYYYT